jgi:hypothetical protein
MGTNPEAAGGIFDTESTENGMEDTEHPEWNHRCTQIHTDRVGVSEERAAGIWAEEVA